MEHNNVNSSTRTHQSVNTQHSINHTTITNENINSDILGNLISTNYEEIEIDIQPPLLIEDVPYCSQDDMIQKNFQHQYIDQNIPLNIATYAKVASEPIKTIEHYKDSKSDYSHNSYINHNSNHNEYTHYNSRNRNYNEHVYSSAYQESTKKFYDDLRYQQIKRELEEHKNDPEYEEIYKEIVKVIKSQKEEIRKKFDEELQKKKKEFEEKIIEVNKIRERINGLGVSGLVNLGNTCYLNSVLQVICHLFPFSDYMLNKAYEPSLRDQCIIKAFEDLKKKNGLTDSLSGSFTSLSSSVADISANGTFNIDESAIEESINGSLCKQINDLIMNLWKRNAKIVPKSMREFIKILDPMFGDHHQQDSQELLNKVLEKIHEETKQNIYTEESAAELKRKLHENRPVIDKENQIDDKLFNIFCDFWVKTLLTENSLIMNYFNGVRVTIVRCSACNNLVFTPEVFMMLELSLDKKDCDIQDLLIKEYNSHEVFDGDNCYFCDTCKCKTEAIMFKKIILPPKILIVMLKRFTYNYQTNTFGKIDSTITYPIKNFNINIATIGNSLMSFAHNLDTNNPHTYGYEYDLCSIIKHIGSTVSSGHYISLCFNELTEAWYNFNDETVHYIPPEEVNNKLIHKDSYLIVYSSIKKKSKANIATLSTQDVQISD